MFVHAGVCVILSEMLAVTGLCATHKGEGSMRRLYEGPIDAQLRHCEGSGKAL